MQGSSGEADIEDRLADTVRKERLGQVERAAWKHSLPCVTQIASGNAAL